MQRWNWYWQWQTPWHWQLMILGRILLVEPLILDLKFETPWHRYRAFSYQILGGKAIKNVQMDPQQRSCGQKSLTWRCEWVVKLVSDTYLIIEKLSSFTLHFENKKFSNTTVLEDLMNKQIIRIFKSKTNMPYAKGI